MSDPTDDVMFNDVNVTLAVLSLFYNVSKYWIDRSPQTMVKDVNELTGLPNNAADLAPKHAAKRGPELALDYTPVPSGVAASMLRYHAAADLTCTGVGDCEGCRQLSNKPKAQWDEDELSVHAELTYRIKLAVHRLAGHGFANPQPLDFDGRPMPLGSDGMTVRFAITPAGLEEAKRRCAGTKYDGKRGWEHAVTRAEFSRAPQWLQSGS